MTTVFDVPAELLINTVADEFRDNNDKIVAPEWTKLVKTGVHKERKPEKNIVHFLKVWFKLL